MNIYRNLRTGKLSITDGSGAKKGKKVGDALAVLIKVERYHVSQAVHKRLSKPGAHREVYAWVSGEVLETSDTMPEGFEPQINFKPATVGGQPYFYNLRDGSPARHGGTVWVTPKGIWAAS